MKTTHHSANQTLVVPRPSRLSMLSGESEKISLTVCRIAGETKGEKLPPELLSSLGILLCLKCFPEDFAVDDHAERGPRVADGNDPRRRRGLLLRDRQRLGRRHAKIEPLRHQHQRR